MEPPGDATCIEWAVAARALAGNSESGDLHVVHEHPDGALIAVIDGLGHGPEAALAARCGRDVLLAHADEPVVSLFDRCHRAISPLRGAAMCVARIDTVEDSLTWAAVGNVDGLLLRGGAGAPGAAREHVLMRGGVVGFRMPPVRAARLTLLRGDLLILATDGVQGRFADAVIPAAAPRDIADRILARHGRDTDDALVLVARYRPVNRGA